MEFDRHRVNQINDDVAAAVKEVAAKYGLEVTNNRWVYGDTCKLTFELGNKEKQEAKAAEKLEQWADVMGLPADVVGRRFKKGRHFFEVKGLRGGKASKKTVKLERDDGKSFVCSPEFVKMHL